MEHVFVKHVQDRRLHHEPIDAHPQAVGEGDQGKGNNKGGEERGHEYHQTFCRQKVAEEPEYPGEEGSRCGLEVNKPVGDDGEQQGKTKEVGDADQKVGDNQGCGAVEPVATFFDVLEVIFEPGGTVGDGHEGHEGRAAGGNKAMISTEVENKW